MKKNIKLYNLVIHIFVILFVAISCDKEVTNSPIEPTPNTGVIKLTSNPEGFFIYLNGRNTGSITPDSLIYMDQGNYMVTLKKKYFKDSSFSIFLSEDQKFDLNVDFSQNYSMYGKLNILSVPSGASIFINDSMLQQVTPFAFQSILPGEYQIKLSFPQHRSASFVATINSGTTSYYSKTLVDTSVWVDYQTSNSGLSSNNLSCIAVDNNNNKWIGSFDKGVMKYDELNFTVFNKLNSGLPGDRVLTISVDLENRIWIGTDNGLGIYDGVNWIKYDKSNSGLKSNEILSVKFDNTGVAWIGSYTGLYKFDGINWIRYNDSEYSIWVNDMEIDNENIWIATPTGIVKLSNEILEYFDQSLYYYPTRIISSVEKDKVGNIWFCHLNSSDSRNGLSYYNGNAFNNIFLGTSSNSMNHLFIDENNNKWISTNEGLFQLNTNNNMVVFNKNNSLLSSDKISSSVTDKNNIIWITNYFNGLNKFKFNSN